jgi:hypothetical protein
VQVVQHLVSVVGSHGNGCGALFHDGQYFPDDGIHIDITGEMVIFKKITRFIAPGTSQVEKVDTFSESGNHSGQIIILTNAK